MNALCVFNLGHVPIEPFAFSVLTHNEFLKYLHVFK